MRLYNTLSKKVEDFQPIEVGRVRFYACGFTVYDYAHLGHLRRYAMDDILIRLLRHEGYKVKFVQNVTDVGQLTSDADTGEDKLEKGAKKYGQSVWDIAKRFEVHYWHSMEAMGNIRPDVSCRATEHINQQIVMIEQLEKKGLTYVIEGDGVYFDTSLLDDYGKLAGLTKKKIAELKAGARVEMVVGKRHPTDFALWKFERQGENRAMVWSSPWAERGFPGWHIECSAMAIHYLGEQLDIHTGGIDHIDIHHTNEIAQAESASGKKPFVKYWVHHNFLLVDNQKMSKSLGNFYTIDDVIKKGYSPMALRLLFLSAHYRSELNFTWSNLAGSQKAWEKLQKLVISFSRNAEPNSIDHHPVPTISPRRGRSPQLVEDPTEMVVSGSSKPNLTSTYSFTTNTLSTRFWSALYDDLDTPAAMAVLWEMIKSDLPNLEKLCLWQDWNTVLGLNTTTPDQSSSNQPSQPLDPTTLPKEVRDLLKKRQAARKRQDWQEADRLRKEIWQLGFTVDDNNKKFTVFSLK